MLLSVEWALLDAANDTSSPHAVVALDSPRSWRKAEFADYKAGRPEGNTAPWSLRLGGHLAQRGWCCLSADSFEADDVLATVAARAVAAGHRVSVLSGDSDLFQLTSDACTVYRFGKKSEPRFAACSPEWIAAKYQIPAGANVARYVALWKALVGEPGDNLPGVRGVGPVKARAVLKLYPTAEQIIESGVVSRKQFEQQLRLVTLREDVPLGEIRPREVGR